MISLKDVYHVFEVAVPLYVAMVLAYISMKWWKLFTPSECSGINKFVAKFSVPLLSFHVISTNNPYSMNQKLILADIIQKILAIFLFAIIGLLSSRNFLDWLITGFSLSTLPNTLILGIPLLKAMYGDEAAKLLAQIVVLQSLIWYTLLLFLFELRAAKAVSMTPVANTDVEGPDDNGTEQMKLSRNEGARPQTAWNILLIVGRKLIWNPNTHASLAGLVWALISFRWRILLPPIIANSISILSDGGLGMAMFSIGLFTVLQTRIIACGTRIAVLSMGVRFIMGPLFMAASSYAVGMRGNLLRTAIVQAALPQGLVPFVFAKEYNLNPDIMSTGIIIGLIVAIPIAIAYYFLLDPR